MLSSVDAAEALSAGWRVGGDHDRLDVLALSDGGPGFLDVMGCVHRGRTELILTQDPWGREIPATILAVPTSTGLTAYVEAAQICGAHLRRPEDDLALATSAGLGRALAAAVELGATSLLVGLTGSAVLDGGLGLAAGVADEPGLLGAGPAALALLTEKDLGPLHLARQRLTGISVVGLGDLSQALLGLAGVAAQLPDPTVGQRIESAVGPAVALVRRAVGEPTDLLSGRRVRWDRAQGAGAGGGLGFGLSVLGARIEDGPSRCLAEVGGPGRLACADLVVTGTAVLGAQTLRGSAISTIAEAAAEHGIPVVAVCGRVEAGRREVLSAGISGAYGVADSLAQWHGFEADPSGRLAARAEAVARTWSPA